MFLNLYDLIIHNSLNLFQKIKKLLKYVFKYLIIFIHLKNSLKKILNYYWSGNKKIKNILVWK